MTDTDRLSLLRTARDLLTVAMGQEIECPNCGAHVEVPGRALSSTVRELRAVLMEIEMIPGSSEETDLDRLADGITDDLAVRRQRRTTG